MIRLLIPILLLGGCSTCIEVYGTYGEVWAASRQALGETMAFQGTTVPSESDNRLDAGTMRAMTTSGSFGSDLFYYLTIKPTGSETVRDHDVCVRVTEIQPEAPQGVTLTKSRRTDVERQVADRVMGLLAANAPPVEGSENQ